MIDEVWVKHPVQNLACGGCSINCRIMMMKMSQPWPLRGKHSEARSHSVRTWFHVVCLWGWFNPVVMLGGDGLRGGWTSPVWKCSYFFLSINTIGLPLWKSLRFLWVCGDPFASVNYRWQYCPGGLPRLPCRWGGKGTVEGHQRMALGAGSADDHRTLGLCRQWYPGNAAFCNSSDCFQKWSWSRKTLRAPGDWRMWLPLWAPFWDPL